MGIRKAETGGKGRRLRKSGCVGLCNAIFYVNFATNPQFLPLARTASREGGNPS